MAEVLATYNYFLIDNGTHYGVICNNKDVCTKAVIPDEYDGKPVTAIGYAAFFESSNLTTVIIPDSITEISIDAFNGCSSLTNITIPDSVTLILSDAFLSCYNLARVNYTGDIDSWAQIEFRDTYANPLYYAQDLYINDQLVTEANITTATEISAYAFNGYSSIENVTIGDSVTSIGNEAFLDCSNLTLMTLRSDIPPTLGSSAIPSTIQKIYVPINSVNAYKTALNWSRFASKIISVSNIRQDFLNYTNVIKTKTKTINGNTIWGSGNIEIQGGGGIAQNEVVDRRETLPQATASSADFVEVGSVLYAKTKYIAWDAAIITLSGTNITTAEVSGVIKYKIYDNNVYIGYFDTNGDWQEA